MAKATKGASETLMFKELRGDAKRRTGTAFIVVPKEEAEALRAWAKANNVSISGAGRHLLWFALREEGYNYEQPCLLTRGR